MRKEQRAIVPHQSDPLGSYTRRPGGSIDNFQQSHPIVRRRTSHYVPVILRQANTPDSGLVEVTKIFVYGGLIIVGFSMVALAIIHMGNSVYWQGERMHQRVQPGYLGGSWNE